MIEHTGKTSANSLQVCVADITSVFAYTEYIWSDDCDLVG